MEVDVRPNAVFYICHIWYWYLGDTVNRLPNQCPSYCDETINQNEARALIFKDRLIGVNVSPVKPCHLLTAKRRLAVTVMIAGDVRAGWVLATTCVTGELDGNFSTMITSCCICSVNISGVCRRRYCSGPRDGEQGERRWYVEPQAKVKPKVEGKQPQMVKVK